MGGVSPLGGRSTSPMVRPMRLDRWAMGRWRWYMGLEELVMLGASGLYTSDSNESGTGRETEGRCVREKGRVMCCVFREGLSKYTALAASFTPCTLGRKSCRLAGGPS